MEETTLNSNFIGNVTELQCILSFTKLGYQVSLPFGGQARYDFLADINGKIIKIQVKTAKFKENGSIFIECRNSHYLNGHHTHSKYEDNEIDYFATYYNNSCYLIPFSECGSTKTLRLSEPKSGSNTTNISWAKDYEISEIVIKI